MGFLRDKSLKRVRAGPAVAPPEAPAAWKGRRQSAPPSVSRAPNSKPTCAPKDFACRQHNKPPKPGARYPQRSCRRQAAPPRTSTAPLPRRGKQRQPNIGFGTRKFALNLYKKETHKAGRNHGVAMKMETNRSCVFECQRQGRAAQLCCRFARQPRPLQAGSHKRAQARPAVVPNAQ